MEMILLLALSVVGALGIGVVNNVVERKVEKVLDGTEWRRRASWLLLMPVLEGLTNLPNRLVASGTLASLQKLLGSSVRSGVDSLRWIRRRITEVLLGALLGYLLGMLLEWWLGWHFMFLAPYVLAVLGAVLLWGRRG